MFVGLLKAPEGQPGKYVNGIQEFHYQGTL